MTIFEFLASNTTAFYAVFLILGLLVGSFLNVVVYRLPIMMKNEWERDSKEILGIEDQQEDATNKFNLMVPASRCSSCQAKIMPWQNIPVLSYLFLRGKCASCKQKISMRYPLVELISGLGALLIAMNFGYGWSSILFAGLFWALFSLSLIDYDHQLLPDVITIPLLWLGIFVNSFSVFTDLQSSVYGALFGYLVLWSIFWVFKLITKKDGMGYGDFKLLAALGAWFGWQSLLLIVLLSSFVAAILGILMILIMGRDKQIPIPFGPYLACAGIINGIWGPQLIDAYFRFAGI